MRKILMTTTAILMGISVQAHAANFVERAAAAFRDKGFSNVEVSEQNGRVTVHAKRGQAEVETVYDTDTGEVLSHDVSGSDDDSADDLGEDDDHGADDNHDDDHSDDHGEDHSDDHGESDSDSDGESDSDD